MKNPEVIILNLKRRHSGVSTTIFALQPLLESININLSFFGFLQSNLKFRNISFYNLLKSIFKKTNQVLVFHARRDHEVLLCLALKLIAIRPIKIVFTWAAIRKKGIVSNYIVSKSDYIIATSEQAAIYTPHVFNVIPHGVNIAYWSIGADKKSHNVLNIAIIGRIRYEKGVDVFVKAMLNHKDKNIKCHIVGTCTNKNANFERSLKDLISSYNADHIFEWHGHIEYSNMPEFIKHIDIVIACPRYEGFGMTLFEAAAAGCAIIGTKTGAFPLLIGDNQRGKIVECDDIIALKLAVEEWISDQAAMKKSAIIAKEYVAKFFSLEAEATELLQVYRQACLMN